MAKTSGKKVKKQVIAKKTEKAVKSQTRIAENVDCLLELHKLQGVLLTQLRKEI